MVTDLSTDQLFGDYKDAPVKKPHPKEYMPNFLDMSPEQRRYLEVNGIEKPPSKKEERNLERSELLDEKDSFGKKLNSSPL